MGLIADNSFQFWTDHWHFFSLFINNKDVAEFVLCCSIQYLILKKRRHKIMEHFVYNGFQLKCHENFLQKLVNSHEDDFRTQLFSC